MKIVTASGKQRVVMTRKEWEAIGKKAGWNESVKLNVGDEFGYTKKKLNELLLAGYGVKVISTGGGYADNLEFGNDCQSADYVQKAIEKGKISIIVDNADRELKYAINSSLSKKGRSLKIVITEMSKNQ